MNERQTIAFLNPCTRAYDTTAPAFFRLVTIAATPMSTILTVNK